MVNPYFPDIVRQIAQRVSNRFSSRPTDPFEVFFEHGIQSQVTQALVADPSRFPLIWLIMNFEEDRGRDKTVFADINFNILILMPTKPDYTQIERDNAVFKPMLLPIYDALIEEFAEDINLAGDVLRHKRILRPYWGGGDAQNANTENLFKQFVDAIGIYNLNLKLRTQCP